MHCCQVCFSINKPSFQTSVNFLEIWPLTVIGICPLIMINVYSKFDQNTINGLIAVVFIILFPYLSLWHWHLTYNLKIYPRIIQNMAIKLMNTHNGLLSCSQGKSVRHTRAHTQSKPQKHLCSPHCYALHIDNNTLLPKQTASYDDQSVSRTASSVCISCFRI